MAQPPLAGLCCRRPFAREWPHPTLLFLMGGMADFGSKAAAKISHSSLQSGGAAAILALFLSPEATERVSPATSFEEWEWA